MACLGKNSCNDDNYECDITMHVVSGATEEQNTCGCCVCCNCCNCGCGAVGNTNNTCANCGPNHYVTNSDCDCQEEETTCTCSSCN